MKLRIIKNVVKQYKIKNIFKMLVQIFKIYGLKGTIKAIKNKASGIFLLNNISINRKVLKKIKNKRFEKRYLAKIINSKIVQNSDVKKRLDLLDESEKINIIYVYRETIAFKATFMYRAYNVFETSLLSNKYNAVFFYTNELPLLIRKFDKIKAIVFCRCSSNKMLDAFIDEAKKSKIKIIVDFDDLIFDKSYTDDLISGINDIKSSKSGWDITIDNHRKLAKRANYGITTNYFLANIMYKSLNIPVYVFPNSISYEKLTIAREYTSKEKYITYLSGSKTHQNDFKIIENAIIKLLNEYQDFVLLIVGYLSLDKKFEPLINKRQIKIISFVDFIELQKINSIAIINLAPLFINTFTNCKSELKFFEAGISRTITVASPSYAFINAIKDGFNGYIARNEQDWYQKIKFILDNYNNLEVANNAQKFSEKNYYVGNLVKHFESIFDSIFDNKNVKIFDYKCSFDVANYQFTEISVKSPIDISKHS